MARSRAQQPVQLVVGEGQADRRPTAARRALRYALPDRRAPVPIGGWRTDIRRPDCPPAASGCNSGNRSSRCRWSGTARGRDSGAPGRAPPCRGLRPADRHPRRAPRRYSPPVMMWVRRKRFGGVGQAHQAGVIRRDADRQRALGGGRRRHIRLPTGGRCAPVLPGCGCGCASASASHSIRRDRCRDRNGDKRPARRWLTGKRSSALGPGTRSLAMGARMSLSAASS